MRQSALAQDKPTVLVMGPPNVGKSALFHQLTSMHVRVGNYAGTTVELCACDTHLDGLSLELLDVPGTYTLDYSNEAEKVAVEMLHSKPDAVLVVLDAVSLEPGLHLLLQILEFGIPTIAVMNRWDLAKKRGALFCHKQLAKELGIEVVPTVAIEGKGLKELRESVTRVLKTPSTLIPFSLSSKERWERVDTLLAGHSSSKPSQGVTSLGAKLVNPWPGIPLAIFIAFLVFAVVIGLGMGLRNLFLLPLFRGLVIPLIISLVESLIPPGLLQRVLIGDYGFLIKGIEWPFTLVLPYVFSFYLALSVLEDTGYLPRLGVVLDGLLQKIGLQGSSVVPLLLGYGCGIPGILATRSFSSRKERISVSLLICLAVPCISQTGAFISLLAVRSVFLVVLTFLVSLGALIVASLILDTVLAGKTDLSLVEIPELLFPKPRLLAKKIWHRLRNYVFDGALPMFWAIAFAALLYESKLMEAFGVLLRPIVIGWLRLPEAASVPLVLGILRRELTVLPLIDLDLAPLQLFTGAIVGLFYVPCIAMVGTLSREFKLPTALAILGITTGFAIVAGGIVARMGFLFPF